jgi:hypothetical protein
MMFFMLAVVAPHDNVEVADVHMMVQVPSSFAEAHIILHHGIVDRLSI